MDASHSQLVTTNRWNTPAFPAMYCCCSRPVARAIVAAQWKAAGVKSLSQLTRDYYPCLSEITWTGDVVDVASVDGVQAGGFPATYPEGVSISDTQTAATAWHAQGIEGVMCRSHAIWQLGYAAWTGTHEPWGEVAIFTCNTRTRPESLARHTDLAWLEER